MKKENAITLIALILTIIVLIILSGIAINTLTNNGIFERTKEARDKWKNAQEDEEIQIAKYSNEIESYVGNVRDEYINFSESPQVIGKWLNNEIVYRKVIIYTPESNMTTGNYSIPHNISNIDKVININVMGHWLNGTENIYSKLPGEGTFLQVGETNVQYTTNGFWCSDLIITMEYTTK